MDKTTRNFTIAWLGGIPIAIINGTVRNLGYGPYMSELLAHQISCATGIILFAAYFWLLNRRWTLTSTKQSLQIGATWLILTILFEFVFGHYIMGHTWVHLLADYDIFAGRLWSIVLLWTAMGPYAIYKVTQR
ncbi:MAG: hypothetical protein NWF07_01620 [Candidatus Bathyarchaeota archaeon]|nr:hypothetical protein [Candidatus Bathyarchaeota archaeon]